MSEDPSEINKDPEAARVLQFMEAGKWRKARDAAKTLCKRDRERYLSLLIQSNVGLVREMLGKGLAKEAETVVAYLETFAPAETVAMLRVEMAAPVSKRQVAALATSGGAGFWTAALRADEILMNTGAVAPADQAAIDLLVTEDFEPDEAETDERAARLAAELKAVRAACAAVGDGRWDEAKDALRSLPRQSVFWQWRIFLRGVRCVFEDEPETARQCFAQLPKIGALARAAVALAPHLATAARPAPASATIPFYLAATGQPAAWAAPLVTAAASWKAGKRLKAFDDLTAGMKPAFPTIEPGLPALLTDAVLPSYARMGDDDWEDTSTMYARFGSGNMKKADFPKSLLAYFRAMCVAEKEDMPAVEIDRWWRLVITRWDECHGPDRLRDSLAWQWLGKALEEEPEDTYDAYDPFSYGRSKAEADRILAKAISAYENSIAADETNEAAALALASLLINKGDSKKGNRMLDALVKKFPRNKGILLLAGEGAINRRSYVKGTASLRAALALDPLDKSLKNKLMVALTLRVREAARKNTPTANMWEEIEPLLENSPPADRLMLSRWMMRVRRSLLDTDPAGSAQAEADAIALAPSDLVRLFFGAALASVYRVPPRKEWAMEWMIARDAADCTWKALIEILRIFNFTTAVGGWGWKQTNLATIRVLEVVARLVTPDRLREDPAGLLATVDELNELKTGASDHASHVFICVRRDLAQAFRRQVKPGARKTDPRLRFASLLYTNFGSKKETTYLTNIIADAEAAGLQELAKRAKAFRANLEEQDSRRPFSGFSSELDDDDDDDAEDGADVAATNDQEAAITKYMELLNRAVMAGNDEAVPVLQRLLLGLGVSETTIESAIQLATEARDRNQSTKTGTAQKAAKKAVKKKTAKAGKPPGDDPSQIDLL